MLFLCESKTVRRTEEADDDPANGHDSRAARTEAIAEEPVVCQYFRLTGRDSRQSYVVIPVTTLLKPISYIQFLLMAIMNIQ